MSWACLDDGFADHPKVLGLSDPSFRLHVAAMCWSARRGTDGVIEQIDLRVLIAMVRGEPKISELEEAELWDPRPEGGWTIHDWHKYNEPANKVKAKKEASKARVAAWRAEQQAKREQGKDESPEQDRTAYVQRTNSIRNDVRTSTPSHPNPSQSHPTDLDHRTLSDTRNTENTLAGGLTPSPATQVALLPDEPQRKPARQTRASNPASVTSATWEAYALAYERRYQRPPTRNGKVNGQLAQLVAQMGADVAPALASYYLTHPARIYVQSYHSIGLLLRDAQALKTQMETSTVMTETTARRQEQTASNPWARKLAARLADERDGVIDHEET